MYSLETRDFQQFVYLARSFNQGKLYFIQLGDALWHDTVFFNANYYWPLGPFPAILISPFVFLFDNLKISFYQSFVQIPLVIAIYFLVFKMARRLTYSFNNSLFMAFAFCFASVFMGVAFTSSSWYFAHVVTVFLLLLILNEYLTKKRYWLIGIIFGLVALTRLTAFLGIIFFILGILLNRKVELGIRLARLVELLSPVVPFLAIMGYYNYFRFGNFLEQGYSLQSIGGQLSSLRSSHGLYSIFYLPTNLYYFLIAPPTPVIDEVSRLLVFPFLRYDLWGMGILFTSPYILKLFSFRFEDLETKTLLLAIFLVALPIFLYYGIGWAQFGYRYSLDFFPLLFLLFAKKMRQGSENLSIGVKVLIIISSLFNYYLFSVSN
ncbi:MAG: hypothetical protein UT08_C0025G0004 [Candidatus Woesebacteria bacterium GW2011_GWB1_38_8]|uniref:Glycosyltransferase RgtA/B/C/D-like domain-containing protein n=1 Tax=Candidatus Woesebacteria bacterium GW2011_GWB1_38_8 TaxID=1618570 RepID=A0A0G0KWC1_9BACT|nr:MAG: hypothetical protein UT08_C0025G0004 [Candidatus Woesebacteria bacterium GW2011_GWB1_38_8]